MMSQNKLEIKIKKDSNGNNVSLQDMPIEAAKALTVFIEALTKIADAQVNSSEVKLSLENGSITTQLVAPDNQFAEIERELEEVINHTSTNPLYVSAYREIQKTIQANGLDYEVFVIKNRIKKPLISSFKSPKKFAVSRGPRRQSNISLEFIKGRLLENGGKNPNFHLDLPDGPLKIQCTESEARKVNAFLYNDIYISAWKYRKAGSKPEYFFCDYYVSETDFTTYKSFIEYNNEAQGTQIHHQIHRKIVETIDSQGLRAVRKIIRLFKNESVDNNKIRTVLITLKSFKETSEIKDILEELASIMRTKLGWDKI